MRFTPVMIKGNLVDVYKQQKPHLPIQAKEEFVSKFSQEGYPAVRVLGIKWK